MCSRKEKKNLYQSFSWTKQSQWKLLNKTKKEFNYEQIIINKLFDKKCKKRKRKKCDNLTSKLTRNLSNYKFIHKLDNLLTNKQCWDLTKEPEKSMLHKIGQIVP